jgi:hypothetical protein
VWPALSPIALLAALLNVSLLNIARAASPTHFAGDAASAGNFTVDSAYLLYSPHNNFSLRLGRFQTAYELDSVIEDSVSHHYSSGMAVDWTDGMQLTVGVTDKLRVHYLAQPRGQISADTPLFSAKLVRTIANLFRQSLAPNTFTNLINILKTRL